VVLDGRRFAVRRDLADVRLADRVFAPHYAAPVRHLLATPAELRSGPDGGADTLAVLDAGAPFEVLEVSAGFAWGLAPDQALAGYLDADALGPRA
jgi:hypothetical protein